MAQQRPVAKVFVQDAHHNRWDGRVDHGVEHAAPIRQSRGRGESGA